MQYFDLLKVWIRNLYLACFEFEKSVLTRVGPGYKLDLLLDSAYWGSYSCKINNRLYDKVIAVR